MAMNRIQFQSGLSLPEFLAQFGTEIQCADALEASRWPQGFRCPECGNADYYLLKGGKHKTFQCKCCRLQTSLIASTLFQSTHLALSIWFLAIYLISQAKTGLSALDLKRQLGVSYPTAWLIQQKLMQAMVERDAQYTLCGDVQVDDAYLGGELAANTGQSSQTVASPRSCRNSTGSKQFWATSKPAWVVLTMRSILPNTEPVTSVRLFIVSTGASILRRFLYVYSSLRPLSGLARHVGFDKLKNLSNQVDFLTSAHIASTLCCLYPACPCK